MPCVFGLYINTSDILQDIDKNTGIGGRSRQLWECYMLDPQNYTDLWSGDNFIFFTLLGTVIDAKTTQPNSMDCAEGENVNLPCNHSTIGGDEYIHWYRQNPNQSPQYVIHGLRGTVNGSMASLTIASDRKSSTLVLP